MTAEYKVHGDVAVITLNNPPVNGLGLATRRALVAGLTQAQADAAVKAIVITGAGGHFCAGHDLKEMRTDPSRRSTKPMTVRTITSIALPNPILRQLRRGVANNRLPIERFRGFRAFIVLPGLGLQAAVRVHAHDGKDPART